MKVTVEELTRIITESLHLVDKGRFSSENYRAVLNETVSMWIDTDTDRQIDDRAESVDMPPGSLAAVYRKGLADWIEHNRYGKGKEQHMEALQDVESFIYNRNDMRSRFPVEWNRVKSFRLKKKQKEFRKMREKQKKAMAREEKRKQKERAEAREND